MPPRTVCTSAVTTTPSATPRIAWPARIDRRLAALAGEAAARSAPRRPRRLAMRVEDGGDDHGHHEMKSSAPTPPSTAPRATATAPPRKARGGWTRPSLPAASMAGPELGQLGTDQRDARQPLGRGRNRRRGERARPFLDRIHVVHQRLDRKHQRHDEHEHHRPGVDHPRHRERAAAQQLMVSPVTAPELILGKLVPYVVIGFLDFIFALALGVGWFSVPVMGSLPLLLSLGLGFVICALAIGILISTAAKTQLQAMQLSFLVLLPSILLSGFIFPRESMPKIIQFLGSIIPLTYFLNILRGISTQGSRHGSAV